MISELINMIWFRIKALAHRRQLERDLDDELAFHLSRREEHNRAIGMEAKEAYRSAHRQFGSEFSVKERTRDMWRFEWLESVIGDLRYAVRMLLKNKGYTLVVVITLALGVGVNTAIFSVLNGIILRPLPYKQPEQIVIVQPQFAKRSIPRAAFSVADLNDYRQQNSTLSAMVEYSADQVVLQDGGSTERVRIAVVSHDFFDLFGVSPQLGRSFLPTDEQPGAPPVLLLSHEYWRRSQNGDLRAIGKTLRLNGAINTVVGVLPPLPQYPDENDVYITTTSSPFRMWPGRISNRNRRFAQVFARLKPGVTLQQANNDVGLIASRLQQQYPESFPAELGYRAVVLPLKEQLTSKARPVLWVLLGAAGFVLLIACANVANFTLSRLSQREQELSLRAALGATRGRLFRQLFTESLLMGLLAAGLGLLLALASHKLLVEFVARMTTRARDISIDGWVLLFAMVAAILTSVITGSALPFFSKYQAGSALKDVARQSTAGAGQRQARNTLIVAQVAFSLALLTGAGLMLRSFVNMQRVDPGFVPEKVLSMHLDLNDSKYVTNEDQVAAGHAILDKVASLPGVHSVAVSSGFPLDPDAIAQGFSTMAGRTSSIQIEGRPVNPGEAVPLVPFHLVSPDYFKTLGIPLIQGRAFLPTDKRGIPGVVLVNQVFARRRFALNDPIGKRVSWDGGKTWLTIVGVVGNTREFSLSENLSEEIYYAADQIPDWATSPIWQAYSLLVRTEVSPATLGAQVRKAIDEAAPETAVSYLMTLEEARQDTLASPRVMTSLLGLFATLALIVAASGIGGILALSVSQRTKEIGVRLALGASPSDVLFMVVKQGMVLVAVGLVCGLAVSFALIKPLKDFLFQITPTDPLTIAGVCALLAAAALLACYIPARRATRIDPMIALRHE